MRRFTEVLTALFLTALMAHSAGCSGETGRSESGGYSVLLIIIDTLRYDHLGMNGYFRDTSPTLDSLAASGTVFSRAQAQSSWTLPAVTSILTGLNPREHGAVRTGSTTYGLSPELITLQGVLHSAGWRSGGFFNVLFLSEDFGFHRGFDHFDCQGVANRMSLRDAGATVDDVLEWMESLEPGEPFLAVVHIYDPHIPYDPPDPWDTLYTDPGYSGDCGSEWGSVPQMTAVNDGDSLLPEDGLRNLIALYDGEIAYTDHEIGRLLATLRERGLADSTLVVVVADHGEEFLDHGGVEHGRTLFQEVTHVPLIFSGPGIPGGVVRSEPVAQTDIAPTLINRLRLETPPLMRPVDILGGEYAAVDIPASNLLWCEVQEASLIRGTTKVIWTIDGSSRSVFDLSLDPGETVPDTSEHPELIEAVEYYWATPPVCTAPEVPFEESMTNQLMDLGYIR